MCSLFGRTRTQAVMCCVCPVSTHERKLSQRAPRVTAGDTSSIDCNRAIERHMDCGLATVVCFMQ